MAAHQHRHGQLLPRHVAHRRRDAGPAVRGRSDQQCPPGTRPTGALRPQPTLPAGPAGPVPLPGAGAAHRRARARPTQPGGGERPGGAVHGARVATARGAAERTARAAPRAVGPGAAADGRRDHLAALRRAQLRAGSSPCHRGALRRRPELDRGAARRPRPAPGGDRGGPPHLHPLPAQGVLASGCDRGRVRTGPAAGARPARPARHHQGRRAGVVARPAPRHHRCQLPQQGLPRAVRGEPPGVPPRRRRRAAAARGIRRTGAAAGRPTAPPPPGQPQRGRGRPPATARRRAGRRPGGRRRPRAAAGRSRGARRGSPSW